MRYRTEFPEAYREGSVNKTFSISKAAYDLLQENIENASPFVNDLIVEALQEKEYYKRRLMKQITTIQAEAKEYGLKVEVN